MKCKIILIFILSFIVIKVEAQSNNQSIKQTTEDVLRKAMDNVAMKYYQTSAISVIDKNIFKNKLTVFDKNRLALVMYHYGDEDYDECIESLYNTYSKIISFDSFDLDMGIYKEINKLYWLKEVQTELIVKIFSPKNRIILNKYIEMVREVEVSEVPNYILDKWDGRNNFIKLVSHTELFWPILSELENHYKPIDINGKTAYTLDTWSNNSSEINLSKKYNNYIQASFVFYSKINSTVSGDNNEYSNPQLFIYPTIFYGVEDPDRSKKEQINFMLIGIIAHELGHVVGKYSSDYAKKSFQQITTDEIKEIENNILFPFARCYSIANEEHFLSVSKIQLTESRADAISYIVQTSIMKKLGLTDKAIYNQATSMFDEIEDSEFVKSEDSHPIGKERKKILTGICQMKQIPPYFDYTHTYLNLGE